MRKTASFLCAAISALLFSSSSWAASSDAIKFTFSIWQQPDHYMVKAIRAWATDVGKRTNGKVTIEFYYGDTLTKGPQAYDGVVKGISDMAAAATGWNPGRFPLTRITDIPLGWTSSRQAGHVTWDYFTRFKPKEWDQTHVLFFFTDAVGELHTKKPVAKLSDLKGMTIRGTGSDVPLIKAMGATPVGMPWSEVYLSLQRGIVQGLISNYASFESAKLAEVTGYTTKHNIRSAGFWVVMNKNKWNALSPDIKKAIDEASAAAVDSVGKALDDAQVVALEAMLAKGDKIITLTKDDAAQFDQALSPITNDWLKEMDAKHLPGKEVLEFVKMTMEKYRS